MKINQTPINQQSFTDSVETESLKMKMNSPGLEVSEWSGVTLSETVYMFYLNWQTFIQTSIMCNVNILSINYIAPLPHRLPLEKLFTQQISIPAKTSGINQEDFKQFFLTAGVSYR